MTRGRILRLGVLMLAQSTVLSCAAVLGAPAGGAGPMGSAFREIGTRRFDFTSPDGVPIISGWFNVTPDTIVVRAIPGPCSYAGDARTSARRPHALVYTCSEMSLHFDREYPVSRITLWYPTVRRTTQRVCAAYEVNARGVRTCTRYELEQVESRVMVSTRLHARVE